MKFNHQLKFNGVAEWKDHYVNYHTLKKIIYDICRLEEQTRQARSSHHEHDFADTESALSEPLLPGGSRIGLSLTQQIAAKEQELVKELDKELADIIKFFLTKEADYVSKLEALDLEIHSLEKLQHSTTISSGEVHFPETDGSLTGAVAAVMDQRRAFSAELGIGATNLEVAPDKPVTRIQSLALPSGPRPLRAKFWQDVATKRGAMDLRLARDRLKGKFIDIFTTFNDLIEYLHLNREGFRKVIKKHDKLTNMNLKDSYWPVVEAKYPIQKKDELEHHLDRLVDLYSILYTNGNAALARDLLSKNLREHIKVERATVWRDMVAMERKIGSATVEKTVTAKSTWKGVLSMYWDKFALMLSVGVFAMLLNFDVFQEPEKNNCLAILVFASMLWATEAVPLFATAMLVPVLVVVLRVLVDRSHPDAVTRLTPQQAAPAIFHAMFSQVIMLLLGGFSIAAALSKHFIAKQMAVAVLSRVGRKPRNVLLASMFVATFMSMWISNVAAPVLCFSLVQPILRTMDAHTPFSKSLVMGIALASNVGGMTSPISSPQNIFAIERMSMDGHPPSWLAWFAVALPVAIVSNLLCWGLILAVYRPWTKTTEVRPLKPSDDPLTFTQVYVIVVSLATVGLWCANTAMQKYTGEMGVVAVLPMIAFFGFGILTKDDFNGFLWNVVMLAMGGSALGEAVKSSGLLLSIAEGIRSLVDGMDIWTVMFIFCIVVLICTTFISHTVGAMVILPIVQSVGETMPGAPHPKLLVMASALMCSGAMGLPVSGFPNMNAVSLEHTTGETFVNTADFLAVGVPSSIGAFAVIVSLGYGLMKIVGF